MINSWKIWQVIIWIYIFKCNLLIRSQCSWQMQNNQFFILANQLKFEQFSSILSLSNAKGSYPLLNYQSFWSYHTLIDWSTFSYILVRVYIKVLHSLCNLLGKFNAGNSGIRWEHSVTTSGWVHRTGNIQPLWSPRVRENRLVRHWIPSWHNGDTWNTLRRLLDKQKQHTKTYKHCNMELYLLHYSKSWVHF